MKKNVDQLINKYLDEVISFRRDIHENPEMGMQEHRTSKKVADELRKLGLEVQTGVGKMGVVGLLKGKGEGKTILLRADMDALPLDEVNDLPFKSKNPGVMHACGHDVHTSILLGVAKVLTELRDEFKGNVKFVFQPAEESNPEGGSKFMIEDGVLENPKVDAAMALHVWDSPLGTVKLKSGPMMAQSDRIHITIKGKSAHASQPQNGIDAIVAAGHIITALQTIVSRNVDPLESAVITLGTIHGGNRYNVIPDSVKIEGTVRIFDPSLSDFMPKRIKAVVENVATALDCECNVEYVRGYTVTMNDNNMTKEVINSFVNSLGEENVIIAEKPALGAEDFCEFTKRVPSVLFWLGMESDLNKGKTTIHNPNLIVDERCIPVGIKAFVSSTLDFLNK